MPFLLFILRFDIPFNLQLHISSIDQQMKVQNKHATIKNTQGVTGSNTQQSCSINTDSLYCLLLLFYFLFVIFFYGGGWRVSVACAKYGISGTIPFVKSKTYQIYLFCFYMVVWLLGSC